jgi:hypothetical protein
MINPLTPVTLEASEIIAVADVPALLAAITTTPFPALPAGKTAAQINSIILNRQGNGSFKWDVRFSA